MHSQVRQTCCRTGRQMIKETVRQAYRYALFNTNWQCAQPLHRVNSFSWIGIELHLMRCVSVRVCVVVSWLLETVWAQGSERGGTTDTQTQRGGQGRASQRDLNRELPVKASKRKNERRSESRKEEEYEERERGADGNQDNKRVTEINREKWAV